jgi:hypothetical protein
VGGGGRERKTRMKEKNYRWEDNIKIYFEEKCRGLCTALIRVRVETDGVFW